MLFKRLVDSASFERILKAPRRSATAHFAMHFHLALQSTNSELSTSRRRDEVQLVEESGRVTLAEHSGQELGAVVPKRHARRAVTRSLLKRQIYAAGERQGDDFPAGQWVVRLRKPFDRALYPSAASVALRDAARAELEALFSGASRINRH